MIINIVEYFVFQLVQNHTYKEKRAEQWKSYVARTSKYPLLMVRKFCESSVLEFWL
jgi:hypothetical protein